MSRPGKFAILDGMGTHRTWTDITADDPGHSRRYAKRWDEFARQGRDIDGEARLIDAMAPRGARILDAGCGQGRLGGYLSRRGHHVTGVDIDPYLISVAREKYPDGRWIVGDLANLTDVLAKEADRTSAGTEAGQSAGAGDTTDGGAGAGATDDAPARGFDVIVAAGNVLTFIDPADRAAVLEGFRDALAGAPESGGALEAGPGTVGTRGSAVLGFGSGRGWAFDDFERAAAEAGLRVVQRFSTWDVRPYDALSDFLVAVLERA